MEWFALGLLGLTVGMIARWILPARGGEGLLATLVLGVAGAYAGGILGPKLELGTVTGFDPRSIALAVGGSLVLILFYRITRR